MRMRRKKDVEAHAPASREVESYEGLDEYTALHKYIATYRDPREAVEVEHEDERKEKKGFFGRGKKRGAGAQELVVPEAWLDVDIRLGISSSDAEARRKKFGHNEITSETTNPFVQFLGYFKGPILYVMEIAVILAAGLRDWIDFAVIVAILMLNAIVGWYQEKQAADVVASLKGDIAMKSTVVRDGREQTILARELVPGDIVIIEEGQTVPADAQLICDYSSPGDSHKFRELKAANKFSSSSSSSSNTTLEGSDRAESEENQPAAKIGTSIVATDQSAITGESLAVDKFMGDTVYYTTGCKRGKAYGVVVVSAKQSFVGKTANLVQGAHDQGHFKAIMDSIGTALLILVVFWMLLAWIGGFFRHVKFTGPHGSSVNLLHYALILLIVGVPVGLPVVTTTTLAVGAAYLAKEKAIVQKLTAIESLAGVDVLCSDKTGTLTANQLSIHEPYVAEGQNVDWMMAVAALASSHNVKCLDPIDKITILTLRRYPKAREILQQRWRTEKFTPFDPVSKRVTSVCWLDGIKYTCAKGAPKAILNLTDCDKRTADLFRDKTNEFASRGFRSLGVAYQVNDGDWILCGLLSMFDPPREDTAQTIIEAQSLGVPVKMLTGDAIAIAKETCKMLALGTKVFNSEKLMNSGLTGAAQHDFVERADGFAEVFPEHKYQVVEMLQQRGHLTAMTGDGVNDAPSLKKADCGIAVEGSTEAAQAAADIVFLSPGLSTIVLAIKTARAIFQRMKAYIEYRIALCLHLEIYLVTSMIIINETMRVELVVFIALFADLATVAVAYDNAHSEQRPVEWQLPKIWIISTILGVLLAMGTWVIRATLYLPNGGIVQSYGSVQEILFLQVALTENWLIFVTRGGKTWPSWQLVGAILAVDVLATLFALFGWFAGEPIVNNPVDLFVQREDGRTDAVTIIVVWCYSIGVTIVLAIVYHLLNCIPRLKDLGRKNRSHKDSKLENFISRLSRLALYHELDGNTGKGKYTLLERGNDDVEDDEK